MGLFTKDIKTMDDLFLHVLQDIYYAEKQILKALARHDREGDQPRADRGLQEPSGAKPKSRCSASSRRSS